MSVLERVGVAGFVVEGASDFHFGRPFDLNPYSRTSAAEAWEAWRFGWLEASHFNEIRGDEERQRWHREAA